MASGNWASDSTEKPVTPSLRISGTAPNRVAATGVNFVEIYQRIFLRHRPELRVSRARHHYVFHLEREKRCPLILAVFHEHMDLMSRLRARLGD